MLFTAEQITDLVHAHDEANEALNNLLLAVVRDALSLVDVQAKEYLLHGVGRRLKLLRHCLTTIFWLFPPATTKPIDPDDLNEVQISLHAFVMNLYGTFENLAWAFVCRHSLLPVIGDRKKVGMFLDSTQQFLPLPLKTYVTSASMIKWHGEYLKEYRDALAHRIPLYIPPATYTQEESEQYAVLEQQEDETLAAHNWGDLEHIQNEKRGLGSACPMFLHAFSTEMGLKPVRLHPQLIADVRTILEFGPLFLRHWHERT